MSTLPYLGAFALSGVRPYPDGFLIGDFWASLVPSSSWTARKRSDGNAGRDRGLSPNDRERLHTLYKCDALRIRRPDDGCECLSAEAMAGLAEKKASCVSALRKAGASKACVEFCTVQPEFAAAGCYVDYESLPDPLRRAPKDESDPDYIQFSWRCGHETDEFGCGLGVTNAK